MKPYMLLKGARVAQGKTQQYMATLLGHKTVQAYTMKENGQRDFMLEDIKKIKSDLNLDQDQIEDIFFK